jgi:hypothetical protein
MPLHLSLFLLANRLDFCLLPIADCQRIPPRKRSGFATCTLEAPCVIGRNKKEVGCFCSSTITSLTRIDVGGGEGH